ncbi:Cell division control protein 24, OB domain 1 [Sesbania bispinosa]|nr:Cell division control protein 24, OB domain 1 [Sesbania bispinosa]
MDSFNLRSFRLVHPSSSCNLKTEVGIDETDDLHCDRDTHRDNIHQRHQDQSLSKRKGQKRNLDEDFANFGSVDLSKSTIFVLFEKPPSKISDTEMHNNEDDEEDLFLRFIEYARSELLSLEDEPNRDGSGAARCGWSWILSRILKTCNAFSSGLTPAILLCELSQSWIGQHRVGTSKKMYEVINHLKKNHWRTNLPNTVTIDSICRKNLSSLNSVLEDVIIDAFVLPGL